MDTANELLHNAQHYIIRPPEDMSSKQHYSINGHRQPTITIPQSSTGFKHHILLTIQLDALSTFVDEQATRRLWKLFTNCAGSIAHGRRLENLSWRSWGRDQSLMHYHHHQHQHHHHASNVNENEEPKVPNRTVMAKEEDEWQTDPSLNDNAQLGLEYRLNSAYSTPEKEQSSSSSSTGSAGGGGGMRTPRISSSPPTTRPLGSRDGDDDDDERERGNSRCRNILQGQGQGQAQQPPPLEGSSSTSVPSLSHSSTSMSTTTTFPRFESSTSLLQPPPPPPPPPPPLLPPLTSISRLAVSRSPPLGPLLKRVIFTPPRPTDHAAAALEELMTSVEGRLSAMQQRQPQDKGSERPAGGHHNEEGQRHPTPQLSSPSQAPTFPTVVILESTPKPTPPDTPARGLSPSSDAQRSIFHFQTLSPLHALINPNQVAPDLDQSGLLIPTPTTSLGSPVVLNPSPAPRSTPMVPTSELSSSTLPSTPAVVVENIKAPVPSAPGINRGHPHSLDSRTSSPNHLASLLNPPAATTVSRHVHSNSEGGTIVVGGMAPTNTNTSHRMFFLQRDSSSLSPDSNSRSGSHSRSPASRSPDVHIVHGPLNRSVPGVDGESRKVAGREDGGAVPQTERDVLEAETKMEKIASESKQNPRRDDNTTEVSRELLEESSARPRPSPPPAEQPSMSVPNASSSSSSHTHHPSRHQRLVMRSKKGGYRQHLSRAHHERPSSRTSTRASVGSRGSGSTSMTAGGRGGSAGAGSVDANAGSTSASGMGSMSTSAGSKLVMKRHPRTHSPLRNSMHVSDAAADALPPSTQHEEQPPVASGSGQQQQQSGKNAPHVSPLAVLPEPSRMEVLERQVMQTAMKSQSAGRKISLESDSEDDYTDDDETDDDEEIVVVKGAQKDTGKVTQRAVVEEEEGSSWSDEDEGEEVVLAKKRPPAQQQKHPGPVQPPSRRNSKDLDHLVGSAGSGRQPHGQAKPQAHLPHVKSKGKIVHNHQHVHVHVQRQQHSPPLRPAVARKTSAGHTRSAPSQDGPLAQAAREALRQRDMFTPLPRETYSSTNLVREKSRTSLSRGGRPSNLTMLLNPDPQWFPQNHPYRQDVHPMDQKLSRSMEELYAHGSGNRSPGGSGSGVKSPRPGIGLGFGGLKMTTTAQPTPRTQVPMPTPAPAPTPVTKSASPDEPPPPKRSFSTLDKSPPAPAPPTKLRPSKSSVAIPAVTGVTASSTPRDEKQADILEMSLRQMGPAQRRPRITRHAQEPARPQLERRTSDQHDQRESNGTPSSRPSNRLGAKPTDIEFSDTEDEAPSSPPPKIAGTSGRSLAKEHLEAVMGGKVKTGMNASRTVVASPDAVPKESRESDPTSYRPPAPPSSPSVYNAHEAKRPQSHLPHTPPSSKRPSVARVARNRPHSSHGQPTAPVVFPTPQTTVTPQRERRQPATSQPPIPVTTAPVHTVAPYPYNLPYPAPLQSPRTTRLNMLASEVPDDLRKDLLWERKTNRIAPMLDNRPPTPLAPPRRNGDLRPMTNITAGGGGAEGDEASEQARLEREAQERYDRMRTQTWNGVIYQRPVW